MQGKTFFIDLTKCTACRGCQVACKQWKKLPAEETRNWGSFQNPKDLTFNTYKLVRFTEVMEGEKFRQWYFFPDQCRHCIYPPCKMVGDMYDDKAILQDEETGAVLFTEHTRNLDFEEIRMSCPYDIPRLDEDSLIQSKCDMCFDRVQNGMLPACVLSCPTGTMNFGERDAMMELANKRLEEVRKIRPEAVLADARDLRVVFLCEESPRAYHRYAVASADVPTISRKAALAKVVAPAKRIFG
ncbi:formate dehydrogenase iron-sulfur subunit [Desulfonatronum thiosulfatophilum]|uniref:Formate dehydrogenase iron-sulfur subunit n=1 Tax=Desulfonatronum thiosulfatophilum TaxID=617002 RepID=A0A1G6ED71_9BACT|nr:4Fe-4S dicluster domain-containing protein [Desulfonatronum thiosulfatophilum]SDB55346.1 formate dehydrogenase iron-sulfur subunit [Desulfonatronum thiosulfatophilum]